MATVYSALCFGGRTGKTVTFTDAGDVVNLTAHGLRTGMGVVFSTTGSLPTGLTAGTTYYARQGADADKFLLYPTAANAIAGTSQVAFSGTGSGTHTVKSAWLVGLSDLSRYGSSGSERIYDSLANWRTARTAATTGFDQEVLEVADPMYAPMSGTVVITLSPDTLITSMVNGARSAAFHNGKIDSGCVFTCPNSEVVLGTATRFDGLSVRASSSTGLFLQQVNAVIRNCVFFSSGTRTGTGVTVNGHKCYVENNIFYGLDEGLLNYGGDQSICANNLAVKCNYGIRSAYDSTANRNAFWFNNASIGNVTHNWGVEPTSLNGATNNFGAAGDTNPPWAIGAGTTGTVATTDFVDWANNDFRPAAGSPLIDSGIAYYGIQTLDILGAVRPSYEGGTPTAFDIGPFEYDHGYGPWPASATISLTSIVSGSRVLITKASDGTVLYNDVPGTSLSFSTTHIGDFNVVVRKATASPFYREFNASGTTVADQTTAIKCLQQLDE